jgi:hypothetical protein
MDCEAHHQEKVDDWRSPLFWRFYHGRNTLEMCVFATVSPPNGMVLGILLTTQGHPRHQHIDHLGNPRNLRSNNCCQRSCYKTSFLSISMARVEQGKQSGQGNEQLHQQTRPPSGNNRRVRYLWRHFCEPTSKIHDTTRRQLERGTYCWEARVYRIQQA